MKYLVILFLLVLGFVELILRGLLPILFVICTFGIGLIAFAEAEAGDKVSNFVQTNVCFEIARIIAS